MPRTTLSYNNFHFNNFQQQNINLYLSNRNAKLNQPNFDGSKRKSPLRKILIKMSFILWLFSAFNMINDCSNKRKIITAPCKNASIFKKSSLWDTNKYAEKQPNNKNSSHWYKDKFGNIFDKIEKKMIKKTSYDKFLEAVAFTMRPDIEGGYCNDKNDPGGRTNMGITHKTYNAYFPGKDIKYITKQEAQSIYYKGYWQGSKAHKIAPHDFKLAVVVFDTAVNMGTGTADQFLKECGYKEDTVFPDVNKYLNRRLQGYDDIVTKTPTSKIFLTNWQERVEKLRNYVKTLKSIIFTVTDSSKNKSSKTPKNTIKFVSNLPNDEKIFFNVLKKAV